jgi:hypothetical protein
LAYLWLIGLMALGFAGCTSGPPPDTRPPSNGTSVVFAIRPDPTCADCDYHIQVTDGDDAVVEDFRAQLASPHPDRHWAAGSYHVEAIATAVDGQKRAECSRDVILTDEVLQLWISPGFDAVSCEILLSSFERAGSDYKPSTRGSDDP